MSLLENNVIKDQEVGSFIKASEQELEPFILVHPSLIYPSPMQMYPKLIDFVNEHVVNEDFIFNEYPGLWQEWVMHAYHLL